MIKTNCGINELRDQIKDSITEVYSKAYPEADAVALGIYVEKAITQIDISNPGP